MKALHRSAQALFCDDVRAEVGGFKTIVGVYAKTFEVAEFPYTFPRLTLHVQGSGVIDDPIRSLVIKVIHEGGELIDHAAPQSFLEQAQRRAKRKGARAQSFSTSVTLEGVTVSEPCTFVAVAVIDGEDYEIGSLTVALHSPKQGRLSA